MDNVRLLLRGLECFIQVPQGEVDDTYFEKLAEWFDTVIHQLSLLDDLQRNIDKKSLISTILPHVLAVLEIGSRSRDSRLAAASLRALGSLSRLRDCTGRPIGLLHLLTMMPPNSQPNLLERILVLSLPNMRRALRVYVATLSALANVCSTPEGVVLLLGEDILPVILSHAFAHDNSFARRAASDLITQLCLHFHHSSTLSAQLRLPLLSTSASSDGQPAEQIHSPSPIPFLIGSVLGLKDVHITRSSESPMKVAGRTEVEAKPSRLIYASGLANAGLYDVYEKTTRPSNRRILGTNPTIGLNKVLHQIESTNRGTGLTTQSLGEKDMTINNPFEKEIGDEVLGDIAFGDDAEGRITETPSIGSIRARDDTDQDPRSPSLLEPPLKKLRTRPEILHSLAITLEDVGIIDCGGGHSHGPTSTTSLDHKHSHETSENTVRNEMKGQPPTNEDSYGDDGAMSDVDDASYALTLLDGLSQVYTAAGVTSSTAIAHVPAVYSGPSNALVSTFIDKGNVDILDNCISNDDDNTYDDDNDNDNDVMHISDNIFSETSSLSLRLESKRLSSAESILSSCASHLRQLITSLNPNTSHRAISEPPLRRYSNHDSFHTFSDVVYQSCHLVTTLLDSELISLFTSPQLSSTLSSPSPSSASSPSPLSSLLPANKNTLTCSALNNLMFCTTSAISMTIGLLQTAAEHLDQHESPPTSDKIVSISRHLTTERSQPPTALLSELKGILPRVCQAFSSSLLLTGCYSDSSFALAAIGGICSALELIHATFPTFSLPCTLQYSPSCTISTVSTDSTDHKSQGDPLTCLGRLASSLLDKLSPPQNTLEQTKPTTPPSLASASAQSLSELSTDHPSLSPSTLILILTTLARLSLCLSPVTPPHFPSSTTAMLTSPLSTNDPYPHLPVLSALSSTIITHTTSFYLNYLTLYEHGVLVTSSLHPSPYETTLIGDASDIPPTLPPTSISSISSTLSLGNSLSLEHLNAFSQMSKSLLTLLPPSHRLSLLSSSLPYIRAIFTCPTTRCSNESSLEMPFHTPSSTPLSTRFRIAILDSLATLVSYHSTSHQATLSPSSDSSSVPTHTSFTSSYPNRPEEQERCHQVISDLRSIILDLLLPVPTTSSPQLSATLPCGIYSALLKLLTATLSSDGTENPPLATIMPPHPPASPSSLHLLPRLATLTCASFVPSLPTCYLSYSDASTEIGSPHSCSSESCLLSTITLISTLISTLSTPLSPSTQLHSRSSAQHMPSLHCSCCEPTFISPSSSSPASCPTPSSLTSTGSPSLLFDIQDILRCLVVRLVSLSLLSPHSQCRLYAWKGLIPLTYTSQHTFVSCVTSLTLSTLTPTLQQSLSSIHAGETASDPSSSSSSSSSSPTSSIPLFVYCVERLILHETDSEVLVEALSAIEAYLVSMVGHSTDHDTHLHTHCSPLTTSVELLLTSVYRSVREKAFHIIDTFGQKNTRKEYNKLHQHPVGESNILEREMGKLRDLLEIGPRLQGHINESVTDCVE